MTDNHRDPESLARGQTFPPPRPRTRTRPGLHGLARAARPPCHAATASSHGVARRAPVARGPPRVPFTSSLSLSLVCWACTRTVNTHPPAAGHANPPPTRSAPRVAIDLDVAWTLGCAYYLRRLDHAHTLMHTPADVIRCSALPCPAWLLLSQPARGTVQSFFFSFFFLPFLVWLGRCVNAVGEGIGAVLARVGRQVVRGC
jgi:hypothetical protein